MRRIHWNRKTAPRQLIAGALVVGLIMGGVGWAQTYPPIGELSADLPEGYDVVRMGADEFVFHEGVFYTKDDQGFKVVAAPIDVVIRRLPVGFETFMVDDNTYFSYAGVYYNRATAGYVVVEPPPGMASSPAMATNENGKSLVVDVDSVNVRSGPGVDYPVVTQARTEDTLTVRGTSGDWYYVSLPDGSDGWVLSKFTRPVSSEVE